MASSADTESKGWIIFYFPRNRNWTSDELELKIMYRDDFDFPNKKVLAKVQFKNSIPMDQRKRE